MVLPFHSFGEFDCQICKRKYSPRYTIDRICSDQSINTLLLVLVCKSRLILEFVNFMILCFFSSNIFFILISSCIFSNTFIHLLVIIYFLNMTEHSDDHSNAHFGVSCAVCGTCYLYISLCFNFKQGIHAFR